jgi:hypothetical protein
MTFTGFGMRIDSARRRAIACAVVLALQLAIALPFLAISPSSLRGVPGPLLIVVSLTASFLLGARLGVALGVVAIILAVTIIDENPYAEPLVWLPVIMAAGLLGDRVRRGERLRREVLDELRFGLVALSEEVPSMPVAARYVPAETAQVLAADFYGVVEAPGGAVAVMVGDVAGHGPRAAAIGTHLRAAWRGLAVAGVPAHETMAILSDTLLAERRVRPGGPQYATLCLAAIEPDQRTASFVVAGHPPPVLLAGSAAWAADLDPDPMIGIASHPWNVQRLALPTEPWSLLFYTDGLVEGRASDGARPLGIEALLPRIAELGSPLSRTDLEQLLTVVEDENGGPVPDDVVMVAVSGRQAHL